ncbi:snRNA-activating protein complex subunit [Momordica charantia]|uniref:snRNA-activating protein complex subunit n=1 Tax=Momordica charantia TaxID=3673 RepID=A0A6J1CM10_MOMCH|nr:snRNA-activating protein complex subunit [Momordica charantia]XP_022142621.1 snRNA-activating protein complex subunit [Momordica charantia]XP_022142622.1 snRNA-activating protein complex subunit [Momordica charantia]XP_022142623.1 snRNA-activating protein complex subunit [Momordica charantia]XP_022142624.1 snRNA-activating protein complex subunit [Momordica charantia]XP_022142625.1 snRNA-activating protein complex subunit [Momordica charantia]XP_022142626.1 snRNA-activating protein complex
MEARNESGASQDLALNGDDLSIPLGGPIYAPNLVGALTRVPHFESTLLQELQSLEAELQLDSSQLCDEEISVDGLKVFTEEQLLNMALEDSSQSGENAKNLPELPEQNLAAGIVRADGEEVNERTLEAKAAPASNENRSRNNTAAKRRKRHNSDIEGNSIAKVAEIAKIKQKQDEDRDAVKLHSFKWKKEVASSSSDKKERLKSLRSTNSSAKVKSLSSGNHEALQHPTTVLFIEVYHKSRKMVKTQEFLAHGRQTLAELKDKLYCLTDKLMVKAGQQDSSGYFLIEDVFCNDLRDPSAVDYSKPVFDWLRNSEDEARKKWECIIMGESQQKNTVAGEVSVSHVPHFRSVSMNKIRFCDLKFRLGAGYLYCHQGNCKHTIVIRDMRLIHPEDVHDRAAYPILTFQLRTRVQKCDACNIYRAKKVTLDDKWAQENPCYFCEDCYFLLHYSKEGNLLYNDFVVYDYLHD